jgi:hypothetical protein
VAKVVPVKLTGAASIAVRPASAPPKLSLAKTMSCTKKWMRAGSALPLILLPFEGIQAERDFLEERITFEIGASTNKSASINLIPWVSNSAFYMGSMNPESKALFQGDNFTATIVQDPYNGNKLNVSAEEAVTIASLGFVFAGLVYAPVLANGKVLYQVGENRYVTFKNKIAPYFFRKTNWTRQEIMLGYETFGKHVWNPYGSLQLDYVRGSVHPMVTLGFTVGFGIKDSSGTISHP